MNQCGEKYFLLKQTIEEIISANSSKDQGFIYSAKIDLPKELKLIGCRAIFQRLLIDLINNAKQAYETNLPNKVVLITAKLENEREFSLSVSDGGKGISLFRKKLIKYGGMIFKDHNSTIYEINQLAKKEFKTKLKIISQTNKGTTIKYSFILH